MDEARFREAEEAYAAGDHRSAAKLFLAAAGRGSEGNGAAYHLAGNSLMKLRREHDAVTVYSHALKDEGYAKRGAVYANLGAAYVAQAQYSDAVGSYERALQEPGYESRYKALQGMAGALWEMSRFEEAARAYRRAALEGENPDPGKALNNLGLSFLRLGRADDAVEAFKAALGLDTYRSKGKAQANLGLAYAASGQHDEAVKAFEKAVQLYNHTLSEDANAALLASRAAADESKPEREVVEGWQTGDLTGADVVSEAQSGTPSEADADEQPSLVELTGPLPPGEPLDEFFTRTDEDMKEMDRAARRAARDERREGRNIWVTVAAVLGVVLLVVAAAVAAFYFGLGYPTQSMTVSGMMDEYRGGGDVAGFWVAVPSGDIEKEMQKVSPSFTEFAVDGVERSPRTSKVDLTVTPAKGSPMHYVVTLSREGVGWKVTGLDNDWR